MSNIEQHVTSLDLSRRLSELGVKENSQFWWHGYFNAYDGFTKHIWTLKDRWQSPKRNEQGGNLTEELIVVPAYLASELAGMLPAWHEDKFLVVGKSTRDGGWTVAYADRVIEDSHYHMHSHNMAEALGLMLAHLVEKRLTKQNE